MRLVSTLEYEALLHLDQMIRLAIIRPDCGDLLAVAIQALDKVRADEGIEQAVVPEQDTAHDVRQISGLAQAMIKRAMDER